MQIVFLCIAIALLVFSFFVVLNTAETSSRLYPGSNVRFLAALPGLLLLLVLFVWFFPEPLSSDYIGWLLIVTVAAGFVFYGAWADARFYGGLFKRAMHAIVVNRQGRALTFKKALWRNFLKLILLPLAPLNFHALSKDFRRQALHDKLSGSFVMWTPEVIAANEPESSYEVDIKS
jgi:uncharacterized RDD family membrane protein YckC